MIVCSSLKGRQWFKASSEVEKLLWPHKQLSEDTLAYQLLKNTSSSEISEEVDADAWIEHENAQNYVVVESSVRVTQELVLSVLWWKDQSQITDLFTDR